jgi:hypothetical protein
MSQATPFDVLFNDGLSNPYFTQCRQDYYECKSKNIYFKLMTQYLLGGWEENHQHIYNSGIKFKPSFSRKQSNNFNATRDICRFELLVSESVSQYFKVPMLLDLQRYNILHSFRYDSQDIPALN